MISRVVAVLVLVLLAVLVVPRWVFPPRTEEDRCVSVVHEPKIRIVNVLDKPLYDDAHIEGSINVPFEQVEEQARTWNKSVPVVFYCANYQCSASGESARMLQAQGFTQVYAYEGGTAEWLKLAQTDSSYKIVGSAQQKYLKNPNEPTAHESDIRVLTASELHDMMEAARLHTADEK